MIRAARNRNYTRLYMSCLATNRAMQALARKYLVDSRAWTMVVEPEPDAVAAR